MVLDTLRFKSIRPLKIGENENYAQRFRYMQTTQAYKSVLKLPGDTLLSHGPGFEPEDAEDDHRRVDSRERVAHGH